VSDPSLAQQTLDRATAALKTGKISTMHDIVQLVQTLSRKNVDVTVQELAELVKKDAGVLAKTLIIANSFGYNPNGASIDSVGEAIHVIGFERVRTLAISLLLVEQTHRNQTPDEQREAAAHALCSGLIAQAAANIQGTVPGEQAYVCAALRHFGRIVMTRFMTEEYRRARGLVTFVPEDSAFREVFGLTPLELGHELLRAEQLPEEVLSALRTCDPASISASAVTPELRMLALADFSTQLCELIFSEEVGAAEFAERTAALAARFAHLLPGLAEQIPDFVAKVQTQFSRLKHGLGIRNLPLKCVERLKDRVAGRDPRDSRATQTTPPFPLGAAPAVPAPNFPPPAPAPIVPPRPTVSSERLRDGLAELVALASMPGTPADIIYRSVLDIITEAFAAPEVILLLRLPDVPTLHVSHGLGVNWRKLQSFATVTPGERTIFGLCLTRRENLLIHDAEEASIAPYVPVWFRDKPDLRAYVLLPIVHAEQPAGLLLAGWATKRKIVIAPDQAQLLRELLAIVSRKHAGP